jgi:phage terminase large subunit-like protein
VRVMVSLAEDLKLALDRVSFARKAGLELDPWQRDLLESSSDRILLNCCRQSGKSTMTAIVALHRAVYHPGSLILCLAPALRQSQELFGKILERVMNSIRNGLEMRETEIARGPS